MLQNIVKSGSHTWLSTTVGWMTAYGIKHVYQPVQDLVQPQVPMVVENVVFGFHLLRVATKVVKRILLSQEERGFLPATT